VSKIFTTNNKLISGRLLPGTDLIQGIKEICKKNDVKYGNIVSCIGSLSKATYIYAIDDEENPVKIRYCDPVVVTGPIELIACQGTIGQDDDETAIHLHGMFNDKYTNIYSGHFYDKDNTVLATIEFLIVSYDSPVINKEFDSETGFRLLRYNDVKE